MSGRNITRFGTSASRLGSFAVAGVLGTLAVSPAFGQQVIEEIIVTAEKRSESIQDVSISVTALGEEQLDLGGIDDVSRLELLVPGLNYAFAGNDAKFNVRGANSSNTFGDNASIVGAFVDGVYKQRASQQTRAFFDVASVEFLRGPQGTLYGRNTFAGALNVYTNRPDTEEMSAEIEVSAQSYDRIRGEGYVNVPISDNSALRLAAVYDKSDGYIRNAAGPDVGAQDDKGLRLSWLWQPTEALEVLARYTYIREDGNEAGLFGYTFLCRNETTDGLTDPFGSVRNCANPVRGSGGLGTASNGPGGDPWRISQDYVRPVDLEDDSFSLDLVYDAGAVTIKSITAFSDFVNDINFDFDFSPTRNSNGGFLEASEGWSQEIQVQSNGEGPFRWTAGFYYSDLEDQASFYIYQQTARDDSTRPTVTIPEGTFTVLQGTDIVSNDIVLGGFFADNTMVDTEYFGVYAQGEFDVTDQLRVIAGVRYNDEEKDVSCGGSNFSGGDRVVNVAPGAAGSSPVVLPGSARDVFTFNCDATDALELSGGFDEVTWRAGAEFDLNDDVMLYATFSTGYLSGAASTARITDQQESQVFELGFRSVLANQTLQLNGAVHFTEYTNLLTQTQRNEGGIVVTTSSNGGDIDAFGVEMDAVWLPTDGLTLSANFAYLDSEFGTFGQGNPYQLYNGQVQSFVDQNGERTPWSPKLTIGASAAYRLDLGDFGSLTPYAQLYYSDDYNTSNLLATDPAHDQDSYTKVDLRLIWESADLAYSIEAFVENIGDEEVLARGNNNSDDVVQTSYLYPRNIGVSVRARF
ncbi:MAG: TonB-dependent receptor [Pseudomonadota bacterium]